MNVKWRDNALPVTESERERRSEEATQRELCCGRYAPPIDPGERSWGPSYPWQRHSFLSRKSERPHWPPHYSQGFWSAPGSKQLSALTVGASRRILRRDLNASPCAVGGPSRLNALESGRRIISSPSAGSVVT